MEMVHSKLLSMLALTTLLAGPLAAASPVEKMDVELDDVGDVPCLDEATAFAEDLVSGNYTFVESDVGDLIECLRGYAQSQFCLTGQSWVDDASDTPDQYAQYLAELVAYHWTIPVAAQIIPKKGPDMYHREIMLMRTPCNQHEMEGDVTTWWIEATPNGVSAELMNTPNWMVDLPE